MKKLSLLLMFAVSFASFTAAQDDIMKDLEKLVGAGSGSASSGSVSNGAKLHNAADKVLDQKAGDKWKYAGAEKIEVVDTKSDTVTIKATEVLFDGNSVEKYKVYYAESSLTTIQDTSKIKDVVITPVEKKDGMVTLKLNGLKADTTYFIVVSPVDPNNPSSEVLSMISDEVNTKTMKSDTAPVAANNGAQGLENVSYTYKNNMVTVTWSPSSATTVDVQVRHQSETSYKKVGTAKGSDGKISFDVTKSGNYFLKMTANDAAGSMIGKEHIQTVKVDSVEAKKDEPVVKTAPKVGPASNILFGLGFFSLLLYVLYRFRRIA